MFTPRHLVPVFSFGLLALAGCGSDEPPPAAGPAGNGVCLESTQIEHAEVIDDSTIAFHMKNGETWLNRLRFPCAGLGMESRFNYVPGVPAQLCSNSQTIQVFRTGGYCEMGQFTRFDPNLGKAPAAGTTR